MNQTYIQLSDGFEFILPVAYADMQVTLKFMAIAIYDFADNGWKKYFTSVYDADCVEYQWRSVELETRRKNFDEVPMLTYEGLRLHKYLLQRPGSSAYVINKEEYSKRRTAFIEKIKALPTTINLGVDEGMKAFMEEVKERDRQRALDVDAEMKNKDN